MHLAAHADLAREMGVETVVTTANGTMTRLAPGPVSKISEGGAGRLYKDGSVIGDPDDVGVAERRKLSFAGHVAVSLAVDRKGELAADPEIVLLGIPVRGRGGDPMLEIVRKAALGTLDSLPRPQRRDADVLAEAVRRAVRAAINEAWGKKPICTVFVAVV